MGERMRRVTIKRGRWDLACTLDMEIFNDGSQPLADHKEDMTYWVAWCDGEAVGFCATKEYSHGIFLIRSGVLKEFRGQGLQKRMIRVRERHHKGQTFFTYVSTHNPASINSLISCGYKAYTPYERYAGEAVYMIKEPV